MSINGIGTSPCVALRYETGKAQKTTTQYTTDGNRKTAASKAFRT